jgi:hypothetical protein
MNNHIYTTKSGLFIFFQRLLCCEKLNTEKHWNGKTLKRVGGLGNKSVLKQWYSTIFVRVPSDVISLHLCVRKVVV